MNTQQVSNEWFITTINTRQGKAVFFDTNRADSILRALIHAHKVTRSK